MAPRKRRERRYRPDVERIVDARTRLGVSQRQLAERAGVHSSLIAQFETGRCSVGDTVLENIAKALGVPVALLVAGDPA